MRPSHLFIAAVTFGFLYAGTAAVADVDRADFVQKASIANRFEIESSKLAIGKSSNNGIKQFAQVMIDDHTKTALRMKEITKDSDIKSVDTLDNKHQELLEKLRSLSGKSFDREYRRMQEEAHRDAVDLFVGYVQDGSDDDLKQFARDTLPTLREHLIHVQKL